MEEPPTGYPPPTLVRRRSPKGRLVLLVAFVLVVASLGAFVVGRMTDSNAPAPAPAQSQSAEAQPKPAPAEPVSPPPSPVGNADASAASLPDAAKTAAAAPVASPPAPAVTVDDAATAAPAKAAHARDGREANLWYYVRRLGDGPGAIYSRDGKQWNFAFDCNTRTRMIEFIAVGTGSPGDFQKQAMSAGQVKLDMDATYSKDGGGIISTTLPATHPIFDVLVGGSGPLEVQLVASHKTILPVSPGLVRLVKTCRGHA